MLAEKVVDSLIQISSQLLQEHNQSNLDTSLDELDELVKSETGSLYAFILLSLELYVRHNDGSTNNSILLASNTHLKFKLLNSLCELIFKQANPQKLKLNYLNFLSRLYEANFKNYHLKLKQTTTHTQLTHSLFHAQFAIIQHSGLDAQVVQLAVGYLNELSSLLNSKQTSQYNVTLFTSMCHLLGETFQLVCDNLTDSLSDLVTRILGEMNQFKIFYEHTQQCLRAKHSHLSCKTDLTQAFTSKHNNLTCTTGNECIFAQLVTYLMNKSLNVKKIDLINKIGICSCVRLESLLECLVSESLIDDLDTSICEYLNLISSSELEFKEATPQQQQHRRQSAFYSLLADEHLINKEKQVKHHREFSVKNNKFYNLILKFDAKSVLLCKCLANNLKKYSKYIPSHQHVTSDTYSGHLEDTLDTAESTQYESFKFITFEIFYLYVKVLKYLLKNVLLKSDETLISDEDLNEPSSETLVPNYEHITSLVELVCKYLNDFLLVNNSYLLNNTNSNVLKSTDSSSKMKSYKTFHSLSDSLEDSKLTTSFVEFLNKKSLKLNRIISLVCRRLSLPLHVSISLSAQLIFFQDLNQKSSLKLASNQTEQSLCKSIIDELNENASLLSNHFILDVLLELYLKSAVFRFALNELPVFHASLIACLNEYIENDQENQLYLELLLDLIFVYFYFNRKVNLKLTLFFLNRIFGTNVS